MKKKKCLFLLENYKSDNLKLFSFYNFKKNKSIENILFLINILSSKNKFSNPLLKFKLKAVL
jgi:hypothetical protein